MLISLPRDYHRPISELTTTNESTTNYLTGAEEGAKCLEQVKAMVEAVLGEKL